MVVLSRTREPACNGRALANDYFQKPLQQRHWAVFRREARRTNAV